MLTLAITPGTQGTIGPLHIEVRHNTRRPGQLLMTWLPRRINVYWQTCDLCRAADGLFVPNVQEY